jgi:quinol monooxygenase YgiN
MRSLRHAACWLLLSLLACGSALAAEPSTPTENPPAMNETSLRYGISGSMGTKPGQRDAVVALLLRDVDELKAVGCDLYVVSVSDDKPDTIFVTEVWKSAQAHKASLQLPSVKAAIAEAMPMLSGEFEQVTYSVVGGLGLSK